MTKLKTRIYGNWKYLYLTNKGYKDISNSYNGGGGHFSIEYVYGIFHNTHVQICNNDGVIFRTLLYNNNYFEKKC